MASVVTILSELDARGLNEKVVYAASPGSSRSSEAHLSPRWVLEGLERFARGRLTDYRRSASSISTW